MVQFINSTFAHLFLSNLKLYGNYLSPNTLSAREWRRSILMTFDWFFHTIKIKQKWGVCGHSVHCDVQYSNEKNKKYFRQLFRVRLFARTFAFAHGRKIKSRRGAITIKIIMWKKIKHGHKASSLFLHVLVKHSCKRDGMMRGKESEDGS